MSAIAGLFFLDGRASAPEDLAPMIRALAHRGPDGATSWTGDAVGFAHLLLRTGSSRASVGLWTESAAGLTVAADVRLDNRAELLGQLGLEGHPPASLSDARLIAAAWARWGEDAPARLLGDFAFALWDERQRALWCVRDQLGVRPLYYYASGDLFLFATEIKALLARPEPPCRRSDLMVAYHLQQCFDDPESTCYDQIFRLPAAHLLRVQPGRRAVRRYWSFDPARELRLGSDEAYAEGFRERMDQAVRDRLDEGAVHGSFLSGGLDSSSIVCLARRQLGARPDRLHTYSFIFPSLPPKELAAADERPYMQSVIVGGGLTPHEVQGDQLDPLGDLDAMLGYLDGLFWAPNQFLHCAAYRQAQAQGIRVMLDGIDGDTTVSNGFNRLPELARTGRWLTLARESRALAAQSTTPYPARSIFWEMGLKPLIPPVLFTGYRRWRYGARPAAPPFSPLINPAFAARIQLTERLQALQREQPGVWQSTRQQHCYALLKPLDSYMLELLNKSAAAYGLEARFPYFDRRLMEFCLAAPVSQKLANGWSRSIQRRGMAGILPELIQWRFFKANLGPNFIRRLRVSETGTITRLAEVLPPTLAEYVERERVGALARRFLATASPSPADAMALYGLLVLGRWLEPGEKPATK